MGGCAIRNCKSRSVKGGTIRFFAFPREESVANQWLRYCRQKTTTKHGRVCSKHFSPSDFTRSLRHILLNETPTKVRTLKPDAVPNLEIENVDEPKAPRTKQEHEVEIICTPDNVECILEPNTISTNDIAGSSKVVVKSDTNQPQNISLAEYKLLKKTAKEHNILKTNLDKIFTPGQVRCLMQPNMRRVQWTPEDVVAALSLRNISKKAYRHLKVNVGVPLPGFSTLRKWVSKYEIKEVLLECDDQSDNDQNDQIDNDHSNFNDCNDNDSNDCNDNPNDYNIHNYLCHNDHNYNGSQSQEQEL